MLALVMTIALRSKYIPHFINGALPQPSNEYNDSIAGDHYDTMVMSWTWQFI